MRAGVLKVDGLMPPRCSMFDTPGVPHHHQLAAVLTPEEVGLLLPKRRLQPRTYRIAAGQTLLVGGVGRVDVIELPGATAYLTVFASSAVACHLSKTEGVSQRWGCRLRCAIFSASPLSMCPYIWVGH